MEPIESLTPGQRDCLRQVYHHRSSKEIAISLGISKATVDQRIDAARAKLGGVSRVEAARRLAAYEGRAAPDPILYDPIPIATDVAPTPSIRTASVRSRSWFPPLTGKGRPNDLDTRDRLVAIVRIAFGGLVAVALLVSAMNGIGFLVRD